MTPKKESSEKPLQTKSESYESFLLAEYNNIAQAHFNTKNSISSFFKHYLLIVSLPLPILAIIYGKEPNSPTNKSLVHDALYPLMIDLFPLLFLIISIVGILVMLYVINLDLDATLYARAVNGIRGYFTKRSGLSIEEELKVRVLPTDNSKPGFTGLHSIFFVVLAFGLIDSFYLSLAKGISTQSILTWDLFKWQLFVWGGPALALHIVLYFVYAKYKESKCRKM
ncbi:hypothetical protein OAC89_05305 [Deltaproteobacteria bacterium]|nr:hypothetical protein [Deltaproteobacteria bacterium]